MSESPVKLSKGTVPTKDTKIILAGAVKVPPIGTYTLLGTYIICINYFFSYWLLAMG